MDTQVSGSVARQESVMRVRPMRADDLDAADAVFRLAFGTFLGLPDPARFAHGADYVHWRFAAPHVAGFVASDDDGRVLGSNIALRWGSFGYFGPLTIHPSDWDRGVGQQLMTPVVEQFDAWGCALSGLFTFSNSPKHVGLYQKFGYRPRHLTMVFSRSVTPDDGANWEKRSGVEIFSELAAADREPARCDCAALTNDVFDGLDVSGEIDAVQAQSLGETVLVRDEKTGDVAAFAVCHFGEGSEGGPAGGFVRFAAARSGADAAKQFGRLMQACESLAACRNCERLSFGINSGRSNAYEWLLDHGYRWSMQGIAMLRPNAAGFNRPDAWVLDDWR